MSRKTKKKKIVRINSSKIKNKRKKTKIKRNFFGNDRVLTPANDLDQATGFTFKPI